jgi:hypothetical protein
LYLHRAAADVQDLGTVVEALLVALRERCQAQQVWVEGDRNWTQLTRINLSCQMLASPAWKPQKWPTSTT